MIRKIETAIVTLLYPPNGVEAQTSRVQALQADGYSNFCEAAGITEVERMFFNTQCGEPALAKICSSVLPLTREAKVFVDSAVALSQSE